MRARSSAVNIAAAACAALVLAGQAATAQAQGAPTVTFEQMVADLGHEDPNVRIRAVRALKQAAYPEAAVPLTRSLNDPEDAIQAEAIAAEVNLHLAVPLVPRSRVGLIIEVRNDISAAALFKQGSGVLSPRPVALDVLTALRTTGRDDNARVAVEALYAFGLLADNVYGAERRRLLAESAAELGAALGVPQRDVRHAAIQIIARLYAWRVGDLAADTTVGDAVVTALNDRDHTIRMAALDALGALRYDRGVQALTDLYQHYGRGSMAVAALGALARVAHPSSLPLFVTALSGRDRSLRLAAVEGLARSGAVDQRGAIDALLLNERNADLLLAGNFAAVLLSEGPVDALVGGLTRSRQRGKALQYLKDVAPGRGNVLGPHVQDPAVAVRLDLIEALSLSGDVQALSVMQRMLQDSDPAVVRAATRGVARIQGVDALNP